MMGIAEIEKFRLNKDDLKDSHFDLLLENVNPHDRNASYGMARKKNPGRIPGVYFWVMRWNGNRYSIYIGKSISIIGRLSNYTGEFQPQSPNNYKMRYFHDFMGRRFLGATLELYYRELQLGRKELHEPENELVLLFDPLINRLETSKESKKVLQEAFRKLYVSSFERVLGSPEDSPI